MHSDYVAHRTCLSVLQVPSELQPLVSLPMETVGLTGGPWVSSQQAVKLQEEHNASV